MLLLLLIVAGTQCNYDLGTSTATINILGCNWLMQSDQSTYRQLITNLPAAMLEVQITEVEDENGRNRPAWNHFQNPPMIQSINMTEIADETEGDPEETLRFQYDGDLMFNVTFQENPENEDSERKVITFQEYKEDSDTCYLDKLGTDSFHVIESLEVFQVRIELWNEFSGNRCDLVDESKYNVSVTNNIGLEQGDDTFATFYEDVNKETKVALGVCSDLAPPIGEASGPCIASVTYDSTLGTSGVTGLFATGRPTIYEKDNTRNMHVSIIGQSGVIGSYTASIFISGLYNKGPGQSFALPTHEPILVLRDPPGGNSYASFKNIVTTAKVVSSSDRMSASHVKTIDLKYGSDISSVVCLPLGFIGIQFCDEVSVVMSLYS